MSPGMGREEAEGLLRRVLRGEVPLERSLHFWERAVERGYTIHDVRVILRNHRLETNPRWNKEHGNFEVDLLGVSLDGRRTRLSIGLSRVGPAIVRTIIDLTPRERRG